MAASRLSTGRTVLVLGWASWLLATTVGPGALASPLAAFRWIAPATSAAEADGRHEREARVILVKDRQPAKRTRTTRPQRKEGAGGTQVASGVRWLGQDGSDFTGPGPSVGPDGFQDVHLALANLAPDAEVKAARLIVRGAKAGWQSGVNPEGWSNAHLERNPKDRTQADLYFQPDRNLKDRPLALAIVYANNKTDTAAFAGGYTDPKLRVARPERLPKFEPGLKVEWLGHDRPPGRDPAFVHLVVSGLTRKKVAAAILSDPIPGDWVYRANDQAPIHVDPYHQGLELHPAGSGRADLYFAPIRDESGATLTLRVVYEDQTASLAQFPGQKCEPDLRVARVDRGQATAKPGDDLHALVKEHGTIRLTPGTYELTRPLVLDQQTTITGEPGAVLRFTQAPIEPAWTAAIKIHASHTTLEGFAVRFAGPIRWSRQVNYEAAVIGTTDNLDAPRNDGRVEITLSHLDLEAPPATKDLEEAARLVRFVTATSGRIVGNTLKGGTITFTGGPWVITDNDYRGTPPHTFNFGVFSCHNTHDLVLERNRVRNVGPSGKTWRFLTMSQSGRHDRIKDNQVADVGPKDGENLPNMNAPEALLTEAYSLHFEGRPLAISADGRVVRIPAPQGDLIRTGDVVSVLAGPQAGTWYRVAQMIDPTTILVDGSLPQGDAPLAIGTGFVHETFEGNTIDCRGGSVATNLVLVGNHYGTRVIKNHLVGGGETFRIAASATERPVTWGWSHTPNLGDVVEGNLIEDSLRGGTLAVEHSPHVKSNRDRVYCTATFRGNTFRWTAPFLSQWARTGKTSAPMAMTVNFPGSLDPGELVLTETGNRVEVPRGRRPWPAVKVLAGTVNGQAVRDRRISFQGATSAAASRTSGSAPGPNRRAR